MDTDQLRDLVARLHATPSEALGLVVLLVGAGVLAAVVVRGPTGPVTVPPPGATGDAVAVPVGSVTVHVSGAVAAPGVRTLADGARVADAILAAGGALPTADLDGLNLARTVADGEQVRVLTRGESTTVDGGAAAPADPARDAEGRLDLNRATAADLEELPGIGPVLAERIVTWRETEGPFREVGQLREIPGIGERTFQELAPAVVVG